MQIDINMTDFKAQYRGWNQRSFTNKPLGTNRIGLRLCYNYS